MGDLYVQMGKFEGRKEGRNDGLSGKTRHIEQGH